MKLCRFDAGADARHGIVQEGYVVDRDEPAVRHSLEEVRLLAPVLPRKFLAIGLNYADHVEETKMKRPEFPLFFNKQSSCVTGPGDPIHLPRASSALDYEGELGFIIGRRCRHVPRERARAI